MPKVLTVDDSRAVRMIVSKQAAQLGFEIDEAEDGEQGLIKLEDETFDLVVLDITMPVLDGPGMLAKMRERGDQTPVVMLTSESKRSIIAGILKLGISDYILKPFKPEELQAKMLKALKLDGAPRPAAADAAAPTASVPSAPSQAAAASPILAPAAAAPAKGAFCDLMVVDDMENVSKRLRTMVPEHLSVTSALTASAALAACRERVCKVILVDSEMPDVDSASLMRQMRIVQPHAAVLLLALRTTHDVAAEAKTLGFDGVVFKPFTTEAIEDLLLRYFDNQEVVQKTDNVLRVAAFKGRETRLPGYFTQAALVAGKSIDEIAAACYAEVILDITQVPPIPEKTARMVMELEDRATKIGLELRLVATGDVAKALRQYSETAKLGLFSSVADAQASGAA